MYEREGCGGRGRGAGVGVRTRSPPRWTERDASVESSRRHVDTSSQPRGPWHPCRRRAHARRKPG